MSCNKHVFKIYQWYISVQKQPKLMPITSTRLSNMQRRLKAEKILIVRLKNWILFLLFLLTRKSPRNEQSGQCLHC